MLKKWINFRQRLALPSQAKSIDTIMDDELPSMATHAFLLLCLLMFIGFIVWGANGQLDVVSRAEGEVIPKSQVKTVQHLEGGIVREILVREGERVKKGQALVTLESTANTADVGELKIRIQSLRVKIIRLKAQIAGKTPKFPEDLQKEEPELIARATAQYKTLRAKLQNERDVQQQLISQYRYQLQEIDAKLSSSQKSKRLVNEKIGISEKLLKLNLNNRMNHVGLLKELSDLDGAIKESIAAKKRINAAISEAKHRLSLVENTFIETAQEELREAERNFKIFSGQLEKDEDSLRRTVLRAPVAGTVKSLFVVTLGGIVPAGGAVVDIVPADDRLIIEAKLATEDIGYVRKGQNVMIRLASSDGIRFGHIDGTVENISPDTIISEQGAPYYKIKITTEATYFKRKQEVHYLFPGMLVECNIITGQRTVLDYLLEPFLGYFSRALQER